MRGIRSRRNRGLCNDIKLLVHIWTIENREVRATHPGIYLEILTKLPERPPDSIRPFLAKIFFRTAISSRRICRRPASSARIFAVIAMTYGH
jgi:hypothetical protein